LFGTETDAGRAGFASGDNESDEMMAALTVYYHNI
jgi:hypothetical protein